MTTPAIYSTGGSTLSNFTAPSGPGDGPRVVVRTASIPSGTTAGTLVGLIPFQKGASVGSISFFTDQLDSATNTTAEFGYIYNSNDTVTNINSTNAFTSTAVSTCQTGGVIREATTSATVASWVATAAGWITCDFPGGPTTKTGNISARAVVSYQI